MAFWKNNYSAGFCQASHCATSVYLIAIKKCQASLCKKLKGSITSDAGVLLTSAITTAINQQADKISDFRY